MSRNDSDHLHRSTLGIYSNLTDEFNPSLQKLILMGNSYAQAFRALAVTSGDYFNALSKIGEKAFYTMSSQSLGDVLIQLSESQQRLTLEMEEVFRQFSLEVLQQMENNIRLDRDYISGSRVRYEREIHNHAASVERQFRGGNSQDYSEYMEFLRESHGEALKEEERRYRFLAEKHCGLIESIAQLMNKTGGSLQQRVNAWTKEINATRQPEIRQPASLGNTMRMREEELRRSLEEQSLGNAPSRAPSPQGSVYRHSADSGGGGGGRRAMRARLAHQPAGSNPTLLPFTKGQIITVVVQQPKKGWLYGLTDNGSRFSKGWFPAAFVEPIDDPPTSASSRSSTVRGSSSSSSTNSLLDQPRLSSYSKDPPAPPPPPPLQSSSSTKQTEKRPAAQPADNRPKSFSESKGRTGRTAGGGEEVEACQASISACVYILSFILAIANSKYSSSLLIFFFQNSQAHGAVPDLFPRGTNPFATVKLKPTSTNDRSAPRLHR
ncbi:BAR/IMD domain-containing adapter protein 2-like 2 [Leuresthes tenuis]|uniref:BAR/IMD domain-containing adapter protein 2-like 2 n=1 Tax=Leuresthes tenuis TaxID=355514 RepID=UPI003B50E822